MLGTESSPTKKDIQSPYVKEFIYPNGEGRHQDTKTSKYTEQLNQHYLKKATEDIVLATSKLI